MDYEKLEKSAKAKGIVRNVVIYTLLILWAVMVLFPFYWMILTSVKATVPTTVNTFRHSSP